MPSPRSCDVTASTTPFVADELAAMTETRLGPTNNRSVVGMMNEFAFLGETHGKLGLTDDLEDLSLRLADTPCGPLYSGHTSPDRELAALVGAARASTAPAERIASVTSIDTKRSATRSSSHARTS